MKKSRRVMQADIDADLYQWTKIGFNEWSAITFRMIHHQYLPRMGWPFRKYELRMISHRRF